MRTLLAIAAAAGLSMTAADTALAVGDAQEGKKIAEERCAACHGLDGASDVVAYPKIGGQYVDYLERALRDYRSGARRNAIMSGFAGNLSDADIRNVAAWYASQTGGVYTVERN